MSVGKPGRSFTRVTAAARRNELLLTRLSTLDDNRQLRWPRFCAISIISTQARQVQQIDVQPNESQATRMTNSNMSVQPYLFFNGRCEEALEFYRSAVGAEVEMLSRFQDAPEPGMAQPGMENKVMHASFRIGETLLMASDGRCDGQPSFEGFSLSIIVPDEEKAESVFNA
ncbi:MAG: VOC family protein, partial [Methyloceanibacter sp.]